MPGPANEKGRKKRQNKKQKTKKCVTDAISEPPPTAPDLAQSPPESASRVMGTTKSHTQSEDQPPRSTLSYSRGHERERLGHVPDERETIQRTDGYRYDTDAAHEGPEGNEESEMDDAEVRLLESSASYIYDPGNGPRVRDFFAFLRSPFAAPQAISFLDVGADESTVGQEQEEEEERYAAAKVIPILNKFLPGEFATILWFNRTRRTQRICPACQRLYHLGEDLPSLIPRADGLEAPDADPETIRMEQFLSGICSIPCFALATYNFGPGAVWAYGIRMHLLDEDTRDVLEGEGSGVDDQGLSMYVRMTRYDGRGLITLLSGVA